MAEIYAKSIAVIIQHGILLMSVWLDGRRSLWRASKGLRDWIGQIIAVIDDTAKLRRVLHRHRQFLAKSARVHARKKHPSCFQLLNNPELLEYTVAQIRARGLSSPRPDRRAAEPPISDRR